MPTNETVTIVLPHPPAAMNPNGGHGKWYVVAAARKKCRKLAKAATEQERISETWNRVEVRAVFYHKQKRRRDDVNHNARLKSYFDGIVDAGLVVDDDSEHWTTLTPIFRIDKKLGRVEITITRTG